MNRQQAVIVEIEAAKLEEMLSTHIQIPGYYLKFIKSNELEDEVQLIYVKGSP